MKEFRGSVAVILSNISTNDTSITVSLVYSNYTKALHHRLANSGQAFIEVTDSSMRGQTHSDLRKHQQTENVKTIQNTTNTVEVI